MQRIDLTEEQIGQIEKLAAVLNQAQLADFLGFSDRTLRDIFARDERASAAYKKGRATAIANVGSGLLQAALEGDASRQMFYLKTQAGWRETQEIQVTAAEPFTELAITRASARTNAD